MLQKIIVTVAGIRPDLIRLAYLIKRLDNNPLFRHIFIWTGQHYQPELKDVFFRDLQIRLPDYTLHVGAPGRGHVEQLSVLQMELVGLLLKEDIRPDMVLLLGDSNSVLVCPVLKKMGWRIGHIEAGMRSGDGYMPEEINRIVCDHCSSLLFAYHANNVANLIREGIGVDKIYLVGNTIVEPVRQYLANSHSIAGRRTGILVDIHRDENIRSSSRLAAIVKHLMSLQDLLKEQVTWICFPRTMASLDEAGISVEKCGFSLVGLMSFVEYMDRQRRSVCLVSDSGTSQEEAALVGTPVIVPRSSTERPQSIEHGCSIMLDVFSPESYGCAVGYVQNVMAGRIGPDICWLGDGRTSETIDGILSDAQTW